MLPLSVMSLPMRLNAPAFVSNVMADRERPVSVLFGESLCVPAKVTTSPFTGDAAPVQFPLDQLLSPAAPSQRRLLLVMFSFSTLPSKASAKDPGAELPRVSCSRKSPMTDDVEAKPMRL